MGDEPLLAISVNRGRHDDSQAENRQEPSRNRAPLRDQNGRIEIQYSCPAELKESINELGGYDPFYDPDEEPESENLTLFKETFRDDIFDGHAKTYTKLKEHMREFKKKFFVPYLKSGDVIYESACGIGLSLFYTLELLKEEGNITNITVYGNEYIPRNADTGNKLLNFLFEDGGNENHLGKICAGDSTDLSFVPSNSFDFVFTGYISPRWDPMELNLGDDLNYDVMRDICDAADDFDFDALEKRIENGKEKLNKNETKAVWAKALVGMAQVKQHLWFNHWLDHMIRIAKPGAPVVIELAAKPYCDTWGDYGGVDYGYWFVSGVETYGWDVVQDSIKIHLLNADKPNGRYHVFMLKNNHTSEDGNDN